MQCHTFIDNKFHVHLFVCLYKYSKKGTENEGPLSLLPIAAAL
jgi:hypothetical protein